MVEYVSQLARERQATCVITGHTHLPKCTEIHLNPASPEAARRVRYMNTGGMIDVLRLAPTVASLPDAELRAILLAVAAQPPPEGDVLRQFMASTGRFARVELSPEGKYLSASLEPVQRR